MASPSMPSLLPGQSPPLVTITPDDERGVIIIIIAICLALSLISIFIRAYVRFQFSRQQFSWDDACVAIAFLFAVIQNGLELWAAKLGLGRNQQQISHSHLLKIQKAEYIDQIFYIACVWMTKLSTIFLLLRLSPKRGHVLAAKIDIGLTATTFVVSILANSLKCSLAHPWIHINSHNAQCSGLLARWIAVAVLDIFTELLLVATSIYLLWAVQMSLANKFTIMSSFAARLPIIVPIILRLFYLSKALSSSNYTFQVTRSIICTQVEMCYAIVAATIPCLKHFMNAMSTNYGGPAEGIRNKMGTYAQSSAQQSTLRDNKGGGRNLFNLAKMKSNGTSSRGMTSTIRSDGVFDGIRGTHGINSMIHGSIYSHGTHVAKVTATPPTQRRLGSIETQESQQGIIRKCVEYCVEECECGDSHGRLDFIQAL